MTESDQTPDHRAETSMSFLSNKAYDTLRFFAVIVMPALGAAYFGLAQIWGLPNAEEVVGSITILDTFLGVLLRQARKSYENSDERFDGSINIEDNVEEGYSNLNVQLDPNALAEKNEITVKVVKKDV